MKRVVVGALVWVVCCVGAASASADTFCVAPDTSCGANNVATLTAAINAANSNGTATLDTIKLGATTYSADGPWNAASGNPVSIIGDGADQTILTISGTQTNATVLTLSDANATLTGVGIVVPSGGTSPGPNTALSLSGTAERIAITSPGSGSQTIGVSSSANFGTPTVEDSTIVATKALVVNANATTTSLVARHDTIIGDGNSGSVGATASASTPFTFISGNASITLNDSIVHGFTTDLSSQGSAANSSCTPTPCPQSDARISFDYNDWEGTETPASLPYSAYSPGAHNITGVDPGFVAPGSSPPDYHLLHSSFLIDKGNPMLESGESSQDADGNPRTVGSATDIGAYEYQHRAPVIGTVGAAPSSAATGIPIGFSGSATDPDPGDTVSLTWSFDDGGSASGANAIHAFSTPGTHTATLTATDSTGLTTTSSTTVTITGPSGPTGPTGPSGNSFPVIAKLKLNPTAFRAATRGPSVAAVAKGGTTITYTDTQAADTTFIVERAVPGVKRGRSCVKPTRRTRRGKRCTLFVHLGGFLHRDVAGANRFRFTGRIFGKALPPANYRLTAEPQNDKLLVGNVLRTQFRIIAPPKKRRRHH